MNRVGNRYRQVWCCMQHRIFVKRLRKPTETHHHHHRQTDITILSFYCLFVILLTVHGFSCFLFSSPKMEWRTTSRLCSIKPGYWKTKKLQSIHGLPQKKKREHAFIEWTRKCIRMNKEPATPLGSCCALNIVAQNHSISQC